MGDHQDPEVGRPSPPLREPPASPHRCRDPSRSRRECDPRSEHCHLEDLRPLLSRTEVVVDGPIEEPGHVETSGFRSIRSMASAPEIPAPPPPRGGTAEGDAGDLGRILEALEQAESGPFVHLQRQQLVPSSRASQSPRSRPCLSTRGTGWTSRSVGPHQSVDLSERDDQVETLQDLLPLDSGRQAADIERRGHDSSHMR